MENVRKHRNICHNRKKKELRSIRAKLSYYKTFSENLLAMEMKKDADTYE